MLTSRGSAKTFDHRLCEAFVTIFPAVCLVGGGTYNCEAVIPVLTEELRNTVKLDKGLAPSQDFIMCVYSQKQNHLHKSFL